MAHYRARQHYRTAQKEKECQPSDGGCYVTKETKRKLLVWGVLLLVVVFIKGMIIGYWMTEENE